MDKLNYDKCDKDEIPNSHIGHGFEYTLYISMVLIMLVSLYVDFMGH